MTIAELQAKRDEVLSTVNVARTQYGDRSVEYAEAEKALKVLDAEIARATVAASSATRRRAIRFSSSKGL